MTEHETDTTLRSWARTRGDHPTPEDLMARVLEIPATEPTTQPRRWLWFLPGTKPTAGAEDPGDSNRSVTRDHDEGGIRSMFSAARLFGIAASITLFAALALAVPFGSQHGTQAPAAPASDLGDIFSSAPLDLVWYSDSGGWFVAEQWAELMEEQFGVEVRVHDHAKGGLAAVEVLESLSEPGEGFARLGDTRPEVAEAEIIVVYGNPRGTGPNDDMETCVTTSTEPRDPPSDYASEGYMASYREVLRSIYARVFDLVGDRPVIVRAIDLYSPVIADWRLAGVEPECTAAWEAWSDSIREVAAEFGVPTVSMYDAFNGPDHSEDPRVKGYISTDGEHTTAAGRDVMVAALHETGYEPIEP